ncbi:hypothetical protein BH11ACT4_BH11ACT4_23270 [soil metagenome]
MALSDERSFDSGLQLERTALAWQRTLLALAVGALLASRGLLADLGAWSYLIGGTGLVVVLVLALLVQRRYRRAHLRLVAGADRALGDAALVAACAVLALGCGVAALAFVITTR